MIPSKIDLPEMNLVSSSDMMQGSTNLNLLASALVRILYMVLDNDMGLNSSKFPALSFLGMREIKVC